VIKSSEERDSINAVVWEMSYEMFFVTSPQIVK
jgi:hypothetical protein